MNADNNTILLPLKKARELKVLGETLARLSGNPVIVEAADELQRLIGYDTTFYDDYPEVEPDPPVSNSPTSAGEAIENTANVLALALWIYRKLGEDSTALDDDEEAGLVYLLNTLRESIPRR
ncbi:MAG: hypothetical protein LBB98_06275 [Treponema sp.]|jgi:hypothetical protein|nr:hypothetical protein [Treponema sp.]